LVTAGGAGRGKKKQKRKKSRDYYFQVSQMTPRKRKKKEPRGTDKWGTGGDRRGYRRGCVGKLPGKRGSRGGDKRS